MLKIGWCGMGGHSWMAEELRPIIDELGMELVTIHEHPNANIKWERHNWLENLRKMDIIICPANYTVQPNKSANRLTQSMALGKPTICSPLPAYLEVAKKYPGSFLIAENKDEWKERLRLLRDTPTLRDQLVQRGLAAAREFSIDEIGKKWLGVIGDREVVDIVIPTYKNVHGIKLCLESIRACTDILHNVIIVDNGNSTEMHDYLTKQGDIVYIKKAPLNFAQAVNEGIRAGKSKYVCVLNDDVIVSKGWLQGMVDACTEGVGCVGVLSNCDMGWLHTHEISIGGVALLPGLNTFEQIEPIIPQIYDYQSPYLDVPEREWVAYYCNLIPRAAIDRTGLLNEEYTNSGEDVDHCRRIRKMGYKIVQTYKSFVFHFGAVSRKALEQEDPGSYQKADKKTNQHLGHLWGKKSVLIYSGPSWERWNHQIMETTGIGGSEVWQIMLSRELSKLGYRVINFADCPQPAVWDGDIEWRHYTEYPTYADQHWVDYSILSRTTDPLRFPLRTGKTFVQIHDVWMLSDKHQLFLDRVDKFCGLSQWHIDFASDYHGIPKEKMAMTANGIDFDRFDSIQVERQPYRLHWSSSWDRGLDNVLYLWPFIREQVPEAELHVYYGCYNWEESCKKRGDSEGLKKIEELKVAMKQPGVFDHGRFSQKELATEIKKASLWLYPSWFSETFCCLPGTNVLTNNGLQKIDYTLPGDKVLTHTGQYEMVTKAMSRMVSEKSYHFEIKFLKDDLRLTGEHPVYSIKKKDAQCLRLHNCICNQSAPRCQAGHCYHSKNGKKYFSKTPCKKLNHVAEPSWRAAKYLQRGDFVGYPVNKNINEPTKFSDYSCDRFNGGEIFGLNHRAKSIKDFIIDEGFLELCGWFVSEGHFERRSTITFSLHKDESPYAKVIKYQLGRLGLDVTDQVVDNTRVITAYSVVLGRFFEDNFGNLAQEKRIPLWVKDLKPEFIKYFLRGVFNGDGSQNRDCVVIECASNQLVYDLFDVLLKFKCVSSIHNTKKPALKKAQGKIVRDYSKYLLEYCLSCSMTRNPALFEFMGYEIKAKTTTTGYIFSGDYVFLPIFKVIEKQYDGIVYNLEVENSNSYVANGVIVHNCITAVECQYAGVPIIANKYAGLTTTLGDSAILLGDGNSHWPYTLEGRKQFLDKTLSLLTNGDKWSEWSTKGIENAKRYSWKNCALRWKKLFETGE